MAALSPALLDFYPRSPCGERQHIFPDLCKLLIISIHALLAESDLQSSRPAAQMQEFLSTLSLRRATLPPHKQKRRNRISIHALLAESDCLIPDGLIPIFIFLSTLSLRRATLSIDVNKPVAAYFYPRSPCGERLSGRVNNAYTNSISIHALLAESDSACCRR